MLVLQRRAGQTIRISENITIHVVRTTNGMVQIGIEAPESVNVVRGELLDRTAVKD